MRVLFLAALGLVVFTACDDTVFGDDCGPQQVYEPTWAGAQDLFEARCNSCHPALSDPDLLVDLQVSAQQAVADMDEDGIPNWQDGDRDGDEVPNAEDDDHFSYYVAPGSPADSLLWQVLTGTSTEAPLMPFGAFAPLCDSEISHIEQWIADGAVF